MIFVLIIAVFDFFLWFLKVLDKLFDPFSDNSENSAWFDKKDAILYFLVTKFSSIFRYFSSD